MPFANPIIGGSGALVYPSIHSPGFASGLIGWSIRKDGSAEFNNITIRGATIESGHGGVFVYDGVPMLGNSPILTIVSPGVTVDPYGNAVNAVLNIGPLNGGHTGFDLSGKQYFTDSGGTTRAVFVTPSGDTSGVKDHNNIQGILTGHATAILMPGTYYINNTLTILGGYSLTGFPAGINTSPGGSNSMSVIIKLAANSNTHMISFGGNNCYIGNLELDGNQANQVSGFGNGVLNQNAYFGVIDRVFIHDQRFRGIDCVNGNAVQVTGCSVTGNGEVGIFLDSTSNDAHIRDCQIARNTLEGINTSAFVSHIVHNDIFSNLTSGIKIVNGRGHQIVGNGIDHNQQHGIAIAPPSGNFAGGISIVGNTFHSNGLQTNNVFNNIVVGNTLSNIDGVSIEGNNFWLDSGVPNLVANHVGYSGAVVTKAHGNQFQASSCVGTNISAASMAKDTNETG